jgi:heme-degrading monooxygenase HmoA
MTSIQQNSGYATLINVFTVDPDRATQLADLLHTATEEVMRHQPGFRSANIHVSTDGTRVVNYAQWDTAEAYRAMLDNSTTHQHKAEAASLAISFDPHLYTVESVHERT